MSHEKRAAEQQDETSTIDPLDREVTLRRALESEFRKRHRRLWAIAYRLTGTVEDADEVLQETFVRAVVSPPPLVDVDLFPWLIRVAMNVGRDLLRRKRHSGHAGRSSDGRSELDKRPDDEGDGGLDQRYELIESAVIAFQLAIVALTPTARAVFVMREVVGLSAEEAADVLDLSAANVRTTHHRARATLKAYDLEQCSAMRVSPNTRRVFARLLQALNANDLRAVRALLGDVVRSCPDRRRAIVAAA